MLGRSLSAAALERVRSWVDKALSTDAEEIWDLYIALTQFICRDAIGEPDWSNHTAKQQLVVCWSHANAVTEILVAGHVIINKLIKSLGENRSASPRLLIEEQYRFEGDTADPRSISLDRLRVHAAAPALFAFHAIAEHQAWAEAHLRRLLRKKDEAGADHPRMEIIRAALTSQDALSSYLSSAWSKEFEAIEPSSAGLFRDGAEQMVSTLLQHEPGSEEMRAGWVLLSQGSANAPVSEDLSALAQGRIRLCELADDSRGLTKARYELMNYALLAATNGWADERERIRSAAVALGPRGDEPDAMVLFEIAIWLARMESDILERTKLLAADLVRLGQHPDLREQAEVAARHFARGLSGQQTEAFVDALAVLMTKY